MKGTLYMLPITLGESTITNVIPAFNLKIINEIDEFSVKLLDLLGTKDQSKE